MIKLEHFDGNRWNYCGEFLAEWMAWMSLGTDSSNYRTIDEKGNVLTDKSVPPVYHAVFSKKQSPLTGTVEYKRADGSLVLCTEVSRRKGCPDSFWDDKELLCEVVSFVRVVTKPGKFPF